MNNPANFKVSVFEDGNSFHVVVPKNEDNTALINELLQKSVFGKKVVVDDIDPIEAPTAPNPKNEAVYQPADDEPPSFLEESVTEEDTRSEEEKLGDTPINIASWQKANGLTIRELYEKNLSYMEYLMNMAIRNGEEKIALQNAMKRYYAYRSHK